MMTEGAIPREQKALNMLRSPEVEACGMDRVATKVVRTAHPSSGSENLCHCSQDPSGLVVCKLTMHMARDGHDSTSSLAPNEVS